MACVWDARTQAIFARALGAERQQTTDTQHARVYYPLHPLVGQSLWIRERRRGPPATYYLVTKSGEGFSVPVWMTEVTADVLRHEGRPRLHVRALLEMVGLTRKWLEPIGLYEEILPSDQAKESPRDNQTTPVDMDTGPAPGGTAPASRRSSRKHRVDRDDARPPRSRGAGERRRNRGAR